MFIVAIFTTARVWTQPKCPSVEEWVTKAVAPLHNGAQLLGHKKEGNLTFRDSMDGHGNYDAKWNKPVGKRLVSYMFLTYSLRSSLPKLCKHPNIIHGPQTQSSYSNMLKQGSRCRKPRIQCFFPSATITYLCVLQIILPHASTTSNRSTGPFEDFETCSKYPSK